MKVHQSLLLAFVFLSVQTLHAQSLRMDDVLQLKDGSSHRGQIVAQQIGGMIRLRTSAGDTLNFAEQDVLRMTQAEPEVPYGQVSGPKPRREALPFRENGSMYHAVSAALPMGRGLGNKFNSAFSLTYRSGIQFKPWLRAGLGSGFDFYDNGGIIPLFAELQGVLGKPNALMPSYAIQLGYGLPFFSDFNVQEFRGGPMLNILPGWTVHTRHHIDWTLSVGYRWQRSYQEFEIWTRDRFNPFNPTPAEPIRVSGDRNYQRIVFQVAMGF